MSRMGEWAAEHAQDTDMEDCAWAQAREEQRQREEAALARCRPLQRELRHLIDSTNTKGTSP